MTLTCTLFKLILTFYLLLLEMFKMKCQTPFPSSQSAKPYVSFDFLSLTSANVLSLSQDSSTLFLKVFKEDNFDSLVLNIIL